VSKSNDVCFISVKTENALIENVPGIILLSREEIRAVLGQVSVHSRTNSHLASVGRKLRYQLLRMEGRV
jgi:hypothetical protein